MIGQVVGSYRITGRIGKGGMGVVYLAEHVMLGSKAAVKVLPAELSQEPEVIDRFFNEAKAATQIRHPGIVQIFDFGLHASGSAYIVMELLEGETLTARIERGPLKPVAAAIIARQIASALAAAHKNGIIHRDLKPDNLFLVSDPDMPEGERVKVLDFGIAKLGASKSARATRSGEVFGTPFYMSPEQCKSAADVDERTDIYSLGCILYEMLTGQPPFTGTSLPELFTAHLFTPPPSPGRLVQNLPAALERTVLAALAKAPGKRQPTMRALAAELDAAIGRRIPTPLPFAAHVPSDEPATTLPELPAGERAPATPTELVSRRNASRQTLVFGGISAALAAVLLATLLIARVHGDTAIRPTRAPTVTASTPTYTVEPIAVPPPDPAERSPASSQLVEPTGSSAPRGRSVPPKRSEMPASASKPDEPTTQPQPAPTNPLGMLALGSKPPCEIYIDGAATGLRTPQSHLSLATGAHTVQLVNTTYAIKETFVVKITAGETTRQIRDFTDRLSPSNAETRNPFGSGSSSATTN